MLALYATALDAEIDASLVSGYFQSRQELWAEPIYRSVFGLLREFGDAEIASLIAPRPVVVEHSVGPKVTSPPASGSNVRRTAAPGRLEPPSYRSASSEVERARKLVTSPSGRTFEFIDLIADGNRAVGGSRLQASVDQVLAIPQRKRRSRAAIEISDLEGRGCEPASTQAGHPTPGAFAKTLAKLRRRLEKSFGVRPSQRRLKHGRRQRGPTRTHLWREVLGKLPDPSLPIRPRTRIFEARETWTTYEVMLDVWPDVVAWGYLLVPKGIEPGERRPVVVCQHGLEGLPSSVINEDQSSRDWRSYRAYANRLAARGFVVYAPHNPYRGKAAFRQLQRKANPLKLTLYSFILGQHQRALEWLATLPFVNPKRIGFYGLSYGGTTAVRVPPLLDGYALSICSAAYNDWARKVVALDFRAAYIFTAEYDHFYFNQANTFNNAELAALMAPRPFMVERGHDDGVAPDQWVASEYAKVRRLYTRLGIPERTEIEFFQGGHWIHVTERSNSSTATSVGHRPR